MKRLILLTTLSLFAINFMFGQDHERYSELVKEASYHYDKKEYQESGQKYSEAFKISNSLGKVNDSVSQRRELLWDDVGEDMG